MVLSSPLRNLLFPVGLPGVVLCALALVAAGSIKAVVGPSIAASECAVPNQPQWRPCGFAPSSGFEDLAARTGVPPASTILG